MKQLSIHKTKLIRIAVIGAGHMGRLHIKTCLSQPECVLVAVTDNNPNLSKSDFSNCIFLNDAKLLSKSIIDAAIIATPENTHAQIAIPLLESGIHCLVEKPLSLHIEDMKRMEKSAKIGSSVLAVGYCERFNAALKSLEKYKKNSIISIKRTSSCLHRKKYVDVTDDLLVHDIDWMIKTFQSQPKNIRVNKFSFHGDFISSLDCQFRFRNGVLVNVFVDYLAQLSERLICIKNNHYQKTINFGRIQSPKEDPLSKQLSAFLLAIQGKNSAIAKAKDASRVYKVLSAIKKNITNHK